MRSTVVILIALCGPMLGACRFDRTPLHRDAPAVRQADASSEPLDADTADASETFDAAPEPADAGVLDAADPLDDDAGSIPEAPVAPPMTGGLRCAGTFCAFGVDPERPCCTTDRDVNGRAARAVDRCGVDLSALPGSPYGDLCWQRDQLGIVDDRCPSSPERSGESAEAGCCSETGLCGTLNSDRKLGCRFEAGSEPRACSMDVPAATCDPTGSFAVRFSVDAAWGGRSGGLVGLTDDGRGEIEVYLQMNVREVDPQTRALTGDGQVCGVVLPPFYSTTLCEAYQPVFPETIWLSEAVPRLTLQGRYECAANGCVLSVEPQTYLLGFSMDNPEAPWPAAGMPNQLRCPEGNGARCFPDHDADGEPGVRVALQTSGGTGGGTGCFGRYEYRGAPLSSSIAAIFDGVRRTDRLQLGVRTRLGGAVRLSDECDAARGSAVAEYVNSRAAGCRVEAGSGFGPNTADPDEPCQGGEARFIDENLPIYELLSTGERPEGLDVADDEPSRGAEVSFVRLSDEAAALGCEAVRAASF